MSPEGFEPPTFGSGIRRAAVAPWVLQQYLSGTGIIKFVLFQILVSKTKPAVGVEPTTPSLRSLCNNHYATRASKPVARFELATLCLQGRCNNHYATPAFPLFRLFHCLGRLAQLVEHWSNKPRVAGSSPVVTTSFVYITAPL